MVRTESISEDRKKLVIEKSLLGKKTSEIAVECHISETSVKAIKRNYNRTGILSNPYKKKPGPKNKLREEGVIVSVKYYIINSFSLFISYRIFL